MKYISLILIFVFHLFPLKAQIQFRPLSEDGFEQRIREYVYIDLCWIYIISPSYSERYLHEWLETIPSNKIMAFGGDYHNVENTFGHSLMARAIVSKVLIEKVRIGYFSEDEAKNIAKKILYDNAVELFNLK